MVSHWRTYSEVTGSDTASGITVGEGRVKPNRKGRWVCTYAEDDWEEGTRLKVGRLIRGSAVTHRKMKKMCPIANSGKIRQRGKK